MNVVKRIKSVANWLRTINRTGTLRVSIPTNRSIMLRTANVRLFRFTKRFVRVHGNTMSNTFVDNVAQYATQEIRHYQWS